VLINVHLPQWIINTTGVEKLRANVGTSGDYSYPELAAQVASQWNSNGQHRSASNPKLDRAVRHIDDTAPFADIAANIDALHAAKRPMHSALSNSRDFCIFRPKPTSLPSVASCLR